MLPTTENFEIKRVIHAAESYELCTPGLVCNTSPTADVLDGIVDDYMISNPVMEYTSPNVRSAFNGGRGLFVSDTGETLLNYSGGALEQFKTANYTRHLTGTTFWLGRPDSAGFYYHWVLDELPRIRYLQDGGHDINTIDHFLVRSNSKAFHRETLKNTGIDPAKIVVIEDDVEYLFDTFVYIECGNGIGLKMNKRVPEYLNSLYPTDSMEELGGGGQSNDSLERIRLYVSRPASVRRHIEGETDYIPHLIESGFTVCSMEGLSVDEQVSLFRRADVVISPHGGALTNLVYCRPGTQVLEIFGRHVFPFYYGLAELCGLEYTALMEDESDIPELVNYLAARAKQSTKEQTENLPISCSPELVVRYLESLENASRKRRSG